MTPDTHPDFDAERIWNSQLPQELPVTFRFRQKHTPGNQAHLTQMLRSELKARGITLNDDLTIDV